MHGHQGTRRVLATILAGAVIATTALFGGSAASATPTTSPPPAVMAGLGDSITQGLMTCSSLSTCAANSWSTGTNASVVSHAARLRAAYPAQPLTTFTNAVTGVTSSNLLAQANKAVTQGATYVTIEIGANDACTRTVGGMTSTAAFEANIRAGIAALTANGAQREIFVASIPNLLRMYDINKGSASARLTWGLLQICQSLLANPSSTRAADVQRRALVDQQVKAYNAVLQLVCSQTAKCRYDGNAIYNFPFEKSHISTRDYFHPSLSGQAVFAATTWPLTQWVS
ncbi:GDSL-type esterase/lipase family protein [Microbacterium sp. SS28]|uniref:GDSL-type esterase/lipase family protein n=1 Tax=Microbacterium sp. SS28 TaxID=2919948 RepID=UPI001FA9BA99|nr:GDSL-type esterase/lipase family protein [Microbacterium sp. SS28]